MHPGHTAKSQTLLLSLPGSPAQEYSQDSLGNYPTLESETKKGSGNKRCDKIVHHLRFKAPQGQIHKHTATEDEQRLNT